MIPVIISGGSGVRLWPVSRPSLPKQFAEFLDESLFTKAISRVQPLGNPWTVTVCDLQVLTERTYRELGLNSAHILFEPKGRNTAAAIAYLCRALELAGESEQVVGVFPADQLVGDAEAFRRAVRLGSEYAANGEIVTLGVKPTFAATGYGYIETQGPVGQGALKAVRFREKPDQASAEMFLKQGGFYWNAGMFIFKVATMVARLKEFAPDIWTTISEIKQARDAANLEDVYSRVRSISIDYAVMEKLPSHVCIPCDFSWSDLGSWDALAGELKNPDSLIEVAAKGNFVYPSGEHKVYALACVSDLIVVDSEDALLIVPKGQSERVKDIVEKLKVAGKTQATQHRFEIRPWGRFDILADHDDFKAKRIEVDPGCQLSYQAHEKRSEHWIVTQGRGELVLNDVITAVAPGQHIVIPLKAKHRMRNNGTEPLVFVEVQLGTYFGEDDITRYQDDYRRK